MYKLERSNILKAIFDQIEEARTELGVLGITLSRALFTRVSIVTNSPSFRKTGL